MRGLGVLPLAVLGLMAAVPLSAGAQPITQQTVVDDIATAGVATVRRLKAAGTNIREPFSGTVSGSASLGQLLTLFADTVAADATQPAQRRQAYKTLLDIMALRVDTQVGSTSPSSGSTSLAAKGAAPAVLGFAVEHGALTRDVNGTVVTFRASPAGFVKALQGKGLLDIYRDYEESARFRLASRFSLAASFDTSRGDAPGTLLADEQQLSAWSVRVVLFNERDPRDQSYHAFWEKLSRENGPYLDARARIVRTLREWSAFQAWHERLVDRLRTEVDAPLTAAGFTDPATLVAADTTRQVLAEELPKLRLLGALPDDVGVAMDAYVSSLRAVVTFRNEVYAYALTGSLATVDWTTTRDPNLPDLHTVTGVYEGSLGAERITDVTANAALSFYSEKVGGCSLKDVALTAQLDRPLGRLAAIPFVLTAAARWQYIPEDVPVPASALVTSVTGDISATPSPPLAVSVIDGSAIAPKGHLVVGQAKLTIPLKGGVRIPLSVTLANRTELITDKKVIARANFGVTFDLDAFAAAVAAR